GGRHLLVTNVMSHCRGAGGEERDVAAALSLELQLVGLDGLANLVIRDLSRLRGRQARVLEACGLGFAKFLVRGRCRRVVAVTVDDHAVSVISAPLEASTPSSNSV